jgi:ABC-type uncharacterized transport system ATPase subunit
LHLGEEAEALGEELSHGKQQWLEIGMALIQQPSLLLLDEPTAGMNRQERKATGELLKRLTEGTTVIIVEHDLDFVKRICDTITVLNQGVVLAHGPVDEIERDSNVKGAFIGRTDRASASGHQP